MFEDSPLSFFCLMFRHASMARASMLSGGRGTAPRTRTSIFKPIWPDAIPNMGPLPSGSYDEASLF